MNKGIKAGDIVIISSVLLLAVIVFLLFLIPVATGTPSVLVVSCNNEKNVYSLSEDRELDLESNGYSLKICIKDGCVQMVESDCPDNTCVHTGMICSAGQLIACVPAGVTLRIAGEEAEYDFIAG